MYWLLQLVVTLVTCCSFFVMRMNSTGGRFSHIAPLRLGHLKVSLLIFLLGFLHVDKVRQADNYGGDEETDHNSDHQLGLVPVL